MAESYLRFVSRIHRESEQALLILIRVDSEPVSSRCFYGEGEPAMAKRRDKLRFGRYFGKFVEDVPTDYLCFVMDNFKRIPIAVIREMTRRAEGQGDEAEQAKARLDRIAAEKAARANRPPAQPKPRRIPPLHIRQMLADKRRNEFRSDLFPFPTPRNG